MLISALSLVLLERKFDDKVRQYSLEGETYLPGVLGLHVIGLLRQQGNLWSNALRMKYGLLGIYVNSIYCCVIGQSLSI